MANSFVFTDWVSQEALRLLINKLVVAGRFNTTWRRDFEQDFPIGDTVRIKLPQRYTIRDGLGYTPQPINRLNTTASINLVKGVDFEYDDMEKMLKMERELEEISDQYILPAMAQIAQEIDSQAALFAYQWANNFVGTLGVDSNNMTIFMQALQRMEELACPPDDEKIMLIPPQVATALIPALSSLLNPTSEISRQFKRGSMGQMAGFGDWYNSMSLWRHTAGTQAATAVTVNGAGQSGSSLLINCTAGDTFLQGDKFSVASTNQVNPMTRRVLSNTPKQFTVTANFTGVGGGSASDLLQISPAIFGPGSQYQNVDALPGNSAVITPWPGTPSPNGKTGAIGLAIHRDAFALVSGKFEVPKAVEMATQTVDKETGIAVRYVKAWDPIQSKLVNRWDVAFGFGVLYADNCAVCIANA